MKTKFLKIFAQIKIYGSYLIAIGSMLTVVWGAFTIYDDWDDRQTILHQNVRKLIDSQNRQNKTDSLLILQQQEISSNQMEMKEQINSIQTSTNSLEASYVKYISRDETLTKEDFINYMDGLTFSAKKNAMKVDIPFILNEEALASDNQRHL